MSLSCPASIVPLLIGGSTRAIFRTFPKIPVGFQVLSVDRSLYAAVMTAVNDEGGQINAARDASGEDTIPKTMQKYKARAQPWMLVVDDNCSYQSAAT